MTSGSVSSQKAIIVVARLLKQRSDGGYGDEGMPPSLSCFCKEAAELLGIKDEQAAIDAASRRLYVQHMMDSINAGRYGDKRSALRMLARDAGCTVETLHILNER